MSLAYTVSLFLICITFLTTVVQGRDLTLVPGANGPDVVHTVIAKLTFSNISLNHQTNGVIAPFMRTMAYVETRDGTRPNSDGGIWNITETVFNRVMNDIVHDDIREEIEMAHPNNYIHVTNLSSINYSDLNIPMYSGLVARLQIHLHTAFNNVCFSCYWSDVFGRRGLESYWEDWARNLTDVEACLVDTDLVFVVDTSGSIRADNFQQVRSFVHNFSTELLHSMQSQNTMSRSRLGIITFNETADEYIALNTTMDRNQVLQLIQGLPYYGGFTNIGAGLELMRQQKWRDDVSILRVALVFTDGKSNRGDSVENVSRAVHDHVPPIVVYALGVGDGVDEEELQAIASRPETSSHIDSFTSQSLDSVTTSYSYQICFTESQDVSFSDLESGSLDRDASIRLRILASVINGLTFRICIEQGTIVVYASIVPNPSSAQYGWRGEVNNNPTELSCLVMFFDILGETNNQVSQNNGRRKKRQLSETPSGSIPFYITLEGQDDRNVFNFNSSEGDQTHVKCEDNPCDQNAICIDTDKSFSCACSEGYTGNGTICTPTVTETTDVTAIATSVIIVAFILGTVIAVAVFLLIFISRKKTQKGDKDKLIEADNDELDLDEDMFSLQGCQRRVPTMVQHFEELAEEQQK